MRITVHMLLAVAAGRRVLAQRGLAVLATAAVVLVLLPAVARADPTLTTTSTVTTKATPGGSTTLEGLSVTDSNPADILQVTVSTNVGTLSMDADPAGLTLAFGNSWTGDSSITFDGLPADINSALGSVELQTGDHAGETAQVSIAALVSQPGYVYSPANEHFYEYVPADGITWDDAFTQAGMRTLEGQQGYLATIPDSEVNDLVASKLEGAQSVWFGARADQTPDQPVARTWRWAAGPLAGQVVSKCTSYYGPCDFTDNAGLYSHWAQDEPNNFGGDWYREGWYADECWMSPEPPSSCWDDSTPVVLSAGEDAAVTNWGSIGYWNDLPRSNPASGYVVEYGDLPHGDSSFDGVATDTSPVSIEGPPLAPTDLDAQRGNGHATLTFAADGNGSPVTGYETSVTLDGNSWATLCSASPCTVPDLVNGETYEITIRAINANGPGPYSGPVFVTPSTTPGAPTGASAERGDHSATVTFDAPVTDGGAEISGYTVTSQPGGLTATCLGSPCLVDGLDNGTSYTFTVRATNVAGDSDESDPTAAVVPAGVPTAPTGVSAEHGNGSATVSFSVPDANGSPITGYTVTTAPGGSTTSCDGSPCVISGLTNGTAYTFTVHAANDIGAGDESDASQPVTPATVPDAPAGFSVIRGDEQIDLSFDAPVFDGGSTITGYEYSLDSGDTWTLLDSSGTDPVTGSVPGLDNGTEYTASVRALNAEGPSAASIAGQAVPATVPDAPTGVSATRGDGQATVSFTAGADNGSAITGHTVIAQPGSTETSCPAGPCVVSGLTNGTSYTFRVVTTNGVGDSNPSEASAAVTPAEPPGPTDNLVVTSQDGAALLSFDPAWTDPSAPVTEYEFSLDDGDSWETLTTNGSGPITASLTGLDNGTTYTIRVRARNELGAGIGSPRTDVTPAGRPSAPRDVTLTPNGNTVLATWTAPLDDGGSPVTGYTVTASPGDASCTDTGTSCTVTGLVPGTTYTFTVVATNAYSGWMGTGESAGGESSTLVPTRSGDPESPRVRAGDRTLSISWEPPLNQGGSSVSGYAVSIDGGHSWRRVRTVLTNGRLSTQVVAVRNGASYAVMVRALNAAGAGVGSEQVLTRTRHWFHDPLSAATRSKEVAVPRRPNSYRGPLRHTTATARSYDGSTAMPATTLFSRKLQSGQAASFGFGPLFNYNSTVLSAGGRIKVQALVRSLTYVTAVTCEGFADYGGRKQWEAQLAKRRAAVVCQALRAYGANVTTAVRGYGSNQPVTVGGTRAARAPNRRVVVRITWG